MTDDHEPHQQFRDLTADEDKTLRASIESIGVIMPILRDPDGNIIDGHQRARIGGELGVEVPERQIDLRGADASAIAVDLNVARRHLTKADRAKYVLALRAEGASIRTIAARIGVDAKTVRNDLDLSGGEFSPPETVTGRDGKTYKTERASQDPESQQDPWSEEPDALPPSSCARAHDERDRARAPSDADIAALHWLRVADAIEALAFEAMHVVMLGQYRDCDDETRACKEFAEALPVLQLFDARSELARVTAALNEVARLTSIQKTAVLDGKGTALEVGDRVRIPPARNQWTITKINAKSITVTEVNGITTRTPAPAKVVKVTTKAVTAP